MTQGTAWDLLFEVENGASFHPDRPAEMPQPDRLADGWAGPEGPGIDWRHWPRSTHTGMPMMHVLTLRVPDEYRRQGPRFPGVALFAGEGPLAVGDPAVGDEASADLFLADLGRAIDHPGLRRRRHWSGGEFAILWLTRSELDAAWTRCRPDPRDPGEHFDFSDGVNGWTDAEEAHRGIWLIQRTDPNAGLAPRDDPWEHRGDNDADGYTWVADADGGWFRWAKELVGRSHLGGTSFPRQEVVPEGMTAWYLELDGLADQYFGDVSIHVDLESDTFDIQSD